MLSLVSNTQLKAIKRMSRSEKTTTSRRIEESSSSSSSSSSSTRNEGGESTADDFREGSKIEADYRGKGKYYPGRITRVRLNGTFDIDYDDGEKEVGIARNLMRSLFGTSSRSNSEKSRLNSSSAGLLPLVGDEVEARNNDTAKWRAAVVYRLTSRGTYDVEYYNGDFGTDIHRFDIRCINSHHSKASVKRMAYLEDKVSKSGGGDNSTYRKGDKVACYWYRASSLGAPKFNQRPKSGIILCFNSDGTYTIELELDGNVIDDVAEEHIKNWTAGIEDLRPSILSSSNRGTRQGSQVFDKWTAVFDMGRKFVKQGKLRHNVPAPDSLPDKGQNSEEKIQNILGSDCVQDFGDTFQKYDRYNDREIDFDSVLLGFRDLGAEADASELRAWTKKCSEGGRQQKVFDLSDFILSFANIFHSASPQHSTMQADESLGRSLRLSGEWKSLGGFARNFGKKQLQDLERAFDSYAERDVEGNCSLRASNILEAFHKVGRAVTVTRLTEYMNDADVRPQDMLSLADFVAVFSFFFSPTSSSSSTSGRSLSASRGQLLTMSEISVQVLQEERWRGSPDQTNAFIRRLCSSRTDATVDCIIRVRDAFEALDTEGQGEVSSSELKTLFRNAMAASSSVDHTLTAFKAKLDRQARGTVSLPELFEQFGLALQELSESSVSIAEAFAMLRMRLSAVDVRAAADVVMKVIDNLLEHSNDPKYWHVNIRNEVKMEC